MKARAFFNTSKLMLSGIVIGAIYQPGFSDDLSNWCLGIDDEGNLFQDPNVCQYTSEMGVVRERRQEQVTLGIEAVFQLMNHAEEIGFWEFQDSHISSMEDQDTRSISLRFGELERTVSVYGAWSLAQEENVEVREFLKLWAAIHESAPFNPA